MKRFLLLAVAIAAVSVMAESNANAQGLNYGYQFGTGFQSANGFGFTRGFAREQPPYFAKFPPVYYSHIVKRPYGISPYAAPAGIRPVELNYRAATPVTVKNPFFKSTPVKAPSPKHAKSSEEKKPLKTAWIVNPYKQPVAVR